MEFYKWIMRMCNYSSHKPSHFAIYQFYFKEYQVYSTRS